MGNKGPTKHLKRHKSPAFWPIHRKSRTWTFKTSSGPHNFESSIPTTIIIRDQLKYAKTAREAKQLLKNGKLIIDGKPRLDEKFPVGLMDVLTIPDTGENFRVLPDHGGKLRLLPISVAESQFKLCQIDNKTTQPKGKVQLNLHDGQNVIVDAEADHYKVKDVLKIKVPEKEIQAHIEFKTMQQCIITGGRSQGAQGLIIGIGTEPGWKRTVVIRNKENEDFRTLARYVFVVGDNEPMISLEAGEE